MKKKIGSKKAMVSIVAVALVGIIVAPMLTAGRSREGIYASAEVIVKDLETYYTFAGNISSGNTQNVLASSMVQIADVEVEEGDKVKEDDTLFVASNGTKIKAGIDGTVNKIFVEEDEQVMAGTILCEILDLDSLELIIKVDEYDMNSVEKGKEMEVNINALDMSITGVVSELSRIATNQNGVAYFEAIIDLEKNSNLKVGMSAEATVLNEKSEGVLVVKADAVSFDDKVATVLLENENGEKIETIVEVGMTDGIYIELISGVSEGDVVYYVEVSPNNMQGMGSRMPMM